MKSPKVRAIAIAVLFAAAAIPLLRIRPLWLDEILQLLATRQPSMTRMIADLPYNPGAVPLGYVIQQEGLRITGYSAARARATSLLFGAASVYLVVLLAAEAGVRRSWIAGVIFAVFPLTLRYATEARVYAQALCLSISATLLFLRILKSPGGLRVTGYALTLTAAVYTQPYSACIGVAHLAFAMATRNRKAAWSTSLAVVFAAVAFLPWYLRARSAWTEGIAKSGLHFAISAKTALMLFRESTGAGYWGAGVLLILCSFTVMKRCLPPAMVALFIAQFVTVLLGVLFADFIFDYFVAVRQFLWILPSLAVLAAAAVDRYGRTGATLGVLLSIICMKESVAFLRTPAEDWQAASDALLDEARRGVCVQIVPPDQAPLYEFFHPELKSTNCGSSRTVIAVSPYSSGADRQRALDALTAAGYRRECEVVKGKSELLFFRRVESLCQLHPG